MKLTIYITEENVCCLLSLLQPQGLKIKKQDANKASSSSTAGKSACCSYA